MAFVKCRTCGGEYDQVLADGSTYFHVCPTLPLEALKTAITDRTVTLSPRQQRALDQAVAADQKRLPTDLGPLAVDVVLGALAVERPNARDENVVADPTTRKTMIKRAGLGVDVLAP